MKKLLLIVVMAFCAESLMAREPFGMNLRIIPGGPLKMIEEKIRVHRVKSCREYRIELIDGTKIKDQTALLSFDGQGRLLGEIAYDNKKPLSKTTCRYERGRLVSYDFEAFGGDEDSFSYVFGYDVKNHMNKQCCGSAELRNYGFTYDVKGRLIERRGKTTSGEGKAWEDADRFAYRYNERGNLSTEVFYYRETEKYRRIFFYEGGRLVRVELKHRDGSTVYRFKYDSRGLVREMAESSPGGMKTFLYEYGL